ncbi:MAG: tetratricopeptide repeat protein [Clostridia bacterium]|nr:tetratricopeptide repeat protein [Clostridia bacterium]
MDDRYNIADELYFNGKYEEALKVFESIETKDSSVENYIGCCYINLKEYEKAKAVFEKLITEDSGFVRSYYNLGRVYLAQNDFEKALHYFKMALEIDDTDPDAYFYVGVYYEKQGDFAKAIEYYQKAVSLNSTDDIEPHISLSACYFAVEQYEEALSESNKAYMICPDDKDVIYNLCLIMIRMRNYSGVIKLLEKHCELASEEDFIKHLNYCKKKLEN